MDEATYQQVRARFWDWTNIELNALDMDEVRELLTWLPALMLALHHYYGTQRIYGGDAPAETE